MSESKRNVGIVRVNTKKRMKILKKKSIRILNFLILSFVTVSLGTLSTFPLVFFSNKLFLLLLFFSFKAYLWNLTTDFSILCFIDTFLRLHNEMNIIEFHMRREDSTLFCALKYHDLIVKFHFVVDWFAIVCFIFFKIKGMVIVKPFWLIIMFPNL